MESENQIRYAPRAVGLKPSAMRGEARLRRRATLLVRAEALPERVEAPAGLWRSPR